MMVSWEASKKKQKIPALLAAGAGTGELGGRCAVVRSTCQRRWQRLQYWKEGGTELHGAEGQRAACVKRIPARIARRILAQACKTHVTFAFPLAAVPSEGAESPRTGASFPRSLSHGVNNMAAHKSEGGKYCIPIRISFDCRRIKPEVHQYPVKSGRKKFSSPQPLKAPGAPLSLALTGGEC